MIDDSWLGSLKGTRPSEFLKAMPFVPHTEAVADPDEFLYPELRPIDGEPIVLKVFSGSVLGDELLRAAAEP